MDRRLKGEIAELKVQLRAAEKGVLVSKPTTSARYDAVLDYGDRLEKVQIKYGNGRPNRTTGCFAAELRRRKQVYKEGAVDALLVYIPAIDKIVRLPPNKFCGKSSVYLRIEPCKKMHKVILIDDYLW